MPGVRSDIQQVTAFSITITNALAVTSNMNVISVRDSILDQSVTKRTMAYDLKCILVRNSPIRVEVGKMW